MRMSSCWNDINVDDTNTLKEITLVDETASIITTKNTQNNRKSEFITSVVLGLFVSLSIGLATILLLVLYQK